MHFYTEEEIKWIRENSYGRPRKETAKLFREQFNLDITDQQFIQTMKRYGAKSGNDTKFKKGQTSHNKGKKVDKQTYKLISRTFFPKGNKPANWKPVGSERINVDGYIEIKVKEPNIWKLKHRVVWEEHHQEVPKGMIINFKDGNKLNCNIDNLMLVSRSENAIANNQIRAPKEYRETAVLIARLMTEANKHD